MTCILVADGVMCADTKMCGDHMARVTKMFAFRGSVFGCAGSAAHAEAFREFIEAGQPKGKREALAKLFSDLGLAEFVAVELRPDKTIRVWESPWFPIQLAQTTYGIGTGAPYALGAFSAGADIEKAVRIASEWDEGSGPEVQTISLAELKKKRRG